MYTLGKKRKKKQAFDVYCFYSDRWQILDFKPEGLRITSNTWIDLKHKKGVCVCDWKRKDGFETKARTRNRKNELKRKDGRGTQGTKKERKVMKPKTWKQKTEPKKGKKMKKKKKKH